MIIKTVQVSKPQALKQLYCDFSTPEPAKYRVDLQKEAPLLQKRIESLKGEERKQFESTFISTWNSLPPSTRQAMLGGAAGGVAGAGLAVASLSIKEIGNAIGGPVGFVISLTALGVVGGALAPAAMGHFSQSKVKVSAKTPELWNFVLPQASLEFEGESASSPAKSA